MTVLTKLLAAGIALLAMGAIHGKDLPRVLFLGDPVQKRAVTDAARELAGRVEVTFPTVPAHDTGTALARIDDLLSDGQWDLIYFNFGLGDLFHKDPATREVRAMSKHAGGVRVSTPEQYERHLDALVRRLKSTGAKLAWASTTPMVVVNSFPSYQGNLYDANSEIEYNATAATIMKRHGVPINDMHAFVLAQFGPEEKHPGFTGYDKALAKKKPLHQPVAAFLLQQLGL